MLCKSEKVSIVEGMNYDAEGPVVLSHTIPEFGGCPGFDCPYCHGVHSHGADKIGTKCNKVSHCHSPIQPWELGYSIIHVTEDEYQNTWMKFYNSEKERLKPTKENTFHCCEEQYQFLHAKYPIFPAAHIIHYISAPQHVYQMEYNTLNNVSDEWNSLWYRAWLFRMATPCRKWVSEWRQVKQLELNPSRKVRARTSKKETYSRVPLKFECKKCGLCCNNFGMEKMNDKITVYEWEVEFLEEEAKKINIKLDIRPFNGYIDGNKLIIESYVWYIPKQCPFFDNSVGCRIHARKPLICAQYPYPDNILIIKSEWYCYSEHLNRQHPPRQTYFRRLTSLPPTIANSTYILRRIHDACDGLKIKKLTDEEISAVGIEYKDLYGELTRLNMINPIFMNSMMKYDFTNESINSEVIQNLKENLFNAWPISPYSEKSLQEIIAHWSETPAKKM